MEKPLSTLIVDVKPGETISFPSADQVSVEFLHKSGKSARLRVTAPRDVKIAREDSNSRCGDGSMPS
jgi:sRNA-binding carbon storage regulator CsrA